MKRLLILGSTGSIGTQALDVVARAPEAFELVGLSAERSHDALVAQARAHGVRRIALSDADAAARAAASASESAIRVTPWARACATSASWERSADKPTSSNAPGARVMTSSACVPMEPVEPRIRSRFIRRPSVARAG